MIKDRHGIKHRTVPPPLWISFQSSLLDGSMLIPVLWFHNWTVSGWTLCGNQPLSVHSFPGRPKMVSPFDNLEMFRTSTVGSSFWLVSQVYGASKLTDSLKQDGKMGTQQIRNCRASGLGFLECFPLSTRLRRWSRCDHRCGADSEQFVSYRVR